MPTQPDPLQQLMGGQQYQAGDFQRSGPQMQRSGPLDALMGAFDIHKPWGMGDAVNAALWALPGARGTIRPRPFTEAPPAANANIATPPLEVDALTQAILDHPKYGLLARQPAESLSDPFLKRRLGNMEARGNQQAKEVAAQLPENARANDLFELLFKRKPPEHF